MNRSEGFVKNERTSHIANWVQQENGDILPLEATDGCWFSAGCYDKVQGKYVHPPIGKFCRSPLDSDSSWCCPNHESDYWKAKYETLLNVADCQMKEFGGMKMILLRIMQLLEDISAELRIFNSHTKKANPEIWRANSEKT